MKIVKGVCNTIIAFFLTIVILANFIIILLSNTLLDANYMLGLVEENGYYEKIETDLKNGFQEYQYQSGLPDEVFENLYSSSELKKDIDSIIKNVYEGTEVTSHAESVKTKILENVNNYLTENNIVLIGEQKKNIEEYQNLIVKVYEDKVNSAFSYVKKVRPVLEKIQMAIGVVKWILIGSLVALLIFALLLNLRTMGLFVSTIGIALLASGSVLECLNFVIHKNIDIQNILLFAQSFSDLIKYILYDLLSKVNFYGIVAIVLGIVGIVWGSYGRYKKEEE